MPYKEKSARYKWQTENKFSFTVSLMRSTDADIIEWLEKQPSRQGAIKALIRAEIARETRTADSNR